jgi:hypothetical protein
VLITEQHAIKAYWGSGGIAPRILDLGSRCRWVVSFTPQPFYPQGKCSWYPLVTRLGGPQNRSGRDDEKFPAPTGTRTPDHPARSHALYHWAIPALRLIWTLDFCVRLSLPRYSSSCVPVSSLNSSPIHFMSPNETWYGSSSLNPISFSLFTDQTQVLLARLPGAYSSVWPHSP